MFFTCPILITCFSHHFCPLDVGDTRGEGGLGVGRGIWGCIVPNHVDVSRRSRGNMSQDTSVCNTVPIDEREDREYQTQSEHTRRL